MTHIARRFEPMGRFGGYAMRRQLRRDESLRLRILMIVRRELRARKAHTGQRRVAYWRACRLRTVALYERSSAAGINPLPPIVFARTLPRARETRSLIRAFNLSLHPGRAAPKTAG